jgi:hypothetical protein
LKRYLFDAVWFPPGGSGRWTYTKIGKRQHKKRNSTQNNTTTQNTQNRKQKFKTKEQTKIILKNISRII